MKPDIFSGGNNSNYNNNSFPLFNNQNGMKNQMGGCDMQTEDHYNSMGMMNNNPLGFNEGNRVGGMNGIGMGPTFPGIGQNTPIGGGIMGANPMFSNQSNGMFSAVNNNNNQGNPLFNNPPNNTGFPSLFNSTPNNTNQMTGNSQVPSIFSGNNNIFNNPNEFSGASSLFYKPVPSSNVSQDMYNKPTNNVAAASTQQPTGSIFSGPPPGTTQTNIQRAPASSGGNDVASRLIKKINGPKQTARLNN